MPALRVVLDTNVLISGIAYPQSIPGKIVGAFRHGALKVVLSDFILDEVVRVLPRLKAARVTVVEAKDVGEALRFMVDIVEPTGNANPEPRDPLDTPILLTLLASGADYLITGDQDLTALAGHYPILTPAEFWARHGD